ncbi:MAG: GNAT family N-acetyltransferase [Anaerolineales bacterium]|nr:GNAT family N-acetyltransferase [Anaerolineales bacterium]
MIIRSGIPEDHTAIFDILADTGWFEQFRKHPVVMLNHVRRMLEFAANENDHDLLVAVDKASDCVMGYISIHWLNYLLFRGEEGYITELFVREDFRGLGIGKALLKEARRLAGNRNANRLSLLNNTDRESYQRHFYEKQGGEEREKMKNFIFRI